MEKIPEYIAAAVGAYCLQLIMFTDSWGNLFSSTTRHYATTTALARFSLLIFAMPIAARIIIGVTKERPGEINPKHWYFDKETGEYYKITGRRGSNFTYDTDDYGKRLVRWFVRANMAEKDALIWGTVGLLILCMFKYFEFSLFVSRTSAMLGGLMGEALVLLGVWLWARAERGRWEMVGPRPTPVRGRESVDEQKAFGDARPAGLADIHRALSGGNPGSGVSPAPHAPRFED